MPAQPHYVFAYNYDLSRAQNLVVEALAGGASASEAAAVAGVCDRTVRSWLSDECFLLHLQRARAAAWRETALALHEAQAEAVAVLKELLGDEAVPAHTCVTAARGALRRLCWGAREDVQPRSDLLQLHYRSCAAYPGSSSSSPQPSAPSTGIFRNRESEPSQSSPAPAPHPPGSSPGISRNQESEPSHSSSPGPSALSRPSPPADPTTPPREHDRLFEQGEQYEGEGISRRNQVCALVRGLGPAAVAALRRIAKDAAAPPAARLAAARALVEFWPILVGALERHDNLLGYEALRRFNLRPSVARSS